MKEFDVVVIGAGSAGFSAAESAKNLGASVCLIEKEKLGGECPNWGCVPTKALLKCAKVFRNTKKAGDFGITLKGIKYDFNSVMSYKDKVVKATTGGGKVGKRYEKIVKELGITYLSGAASFLDSHSVVVRYKNGEEKKVKGKSFVIATGTVPFIPPIKGIDSVPYITFKEAISLTNRPKSVVIVGGGPIGSEFATFFSSFEIPTTVIQLPSVILHREDLEISKLAGKALAELGVTILTNTKTVELKKHGDLVALSLEVNGQEQRIEAQTLLMATGMRSNTEGMNLHMAKVKLDNRGSIETDSKQQTSQKHIFACGDVDGGMMFTHTAHYEGYVAGHNAVLRSQAKTRGFLQSDTRVVPRVTFVEPPVASVGYTENQVLEKYKHALVAEFPIAALGRSTTESVRSGLLKIVSHPQTGKVLGGHMIGPSAGEVIHEIALAVYLKATLDDLGEMIHAFPTYSEAISGAASRAKKV